VYNNERPHTAVGGIPPRQKVAPAAWFYFWEWWKMGGLPR
jgi:hypothetical protein